VRSDPITLTPVPYRPLPPHSALGLSAFYISLLSIMCGFLLDYVTRSARENGERNRDPKPKGPDVKSAPTELQGKKTLIRFTEEVGVYSQPAPARHVSRVIH
jgi:hypothetical protein